MDTKIYKELNRFGLSDKSAKVYAVLLDLGGAYPSRIAESAHLNRTTVYKILIDLSIKGLINEINKNGKVFYQVERPSQLIKYAKNRRDTADEQYERIKNLMPEIEGLYSLTPNKPKIRYFEDSSSVASIFEDQVDVKKPYEMVGFANIERLEKFLKPSFIKWYIKEKERKGITTRGILPDTKLNRTYNERVYKVINKKFQLNNIRYIPKEEFPFNGEITIYGENKMSIINFIDEQAVGIIIEDKAIHDMMVRIFELSWKGSQ